ncbi:sugar efflux transporter for intercellular exchange [Leptospira sp. B5-022]|jgi:MtN3 and saliva related transmembrane protein|nr:sugar efflux transporter for intercellular exchange [Leptospira sp. B5-022]
MMDPISLLGFIACTLTTLAFLPQLIKVILEKRTRDISRNMYLVLSVGVFFWLCYGVLKNDFPIILANSFTLLFTTTILWYKLRSKEEE